MKIALITLIAASIGIYMAFQIDRPDTALFILFLSGLLITASIYQLYYEIRDKKKDTRIK